MDRQGCFFLFCFFVCLFTNVVFVLQTPFPSYHSGLAVPTSAGVRGGRSLSFTTSTGTSQVVAAAAAASGARSGYAPAAPTEDASNPFSPAALVTTGAAASAPAIAVGSVPGYKPGKVAVRAGPAAVGSAAASRPVVPGGNPSAPEQIPEEDEVCLHVYACVCVCVCVCGVCVCM